MEHRISPSIGWGPSGKSLCGTSISSSSCCCCCCYKNQTKPRSIPLLRSGAASPGDYRGHADTAEIQYRCAKRLALGIRGELKGKRGGRLGNYIQRRRSHQSHGRADCWPSDRRILRELAGEEGERRLCKLAKMDVEKRVDWFSSRRGQCRDFVKSSRVRWGFGFASSGLGVFGFYSPLQFSEQRKGKGISCALRIYMYDGSDLRVNGVWVWAQPQRKLHGPNHDPPRLALIIFFFF